MGWLQEEVGGSFSCFNSHHGASYSHLICKCILQEKIRNQSKGITYVICVPIFSVCRKLPLGSYVCRQERRNKSMALGTFQESSVREFPLDFPLRHNGISLFNILKFSLSELVWNSIAELVDFSKFSFKAMS